VRRRKVSILRMSTGSSRAFQRVDESLSTPVVAGEILLV
jgi:hypothetical protein